MVLVEGLNGVTVTIVTNNPFTSRNDRNDD